MMDIPTEILGTALPGLVTLYWACAVLGGGLLLISTILGGQGDGGLDADLDAGFDADFDADFDAGFDTDFSGDLAVDGDLAMDADVADVAAGHLDAAGDASAGSAADGAFTLSSWFSMHFVVYFTAAFGLVGVILTHLTDWAGTGVALVALAAGIAVGQTAHQVLRMLASIVRKQRTELDEFLNQPARVTIAIMDGRKGEIAMKVRGSDRYLPAVSRHADSGFKAGDTVAVVDYSGGVATVVSAQEFDFVSGS